jgi:L-ascorbate metabolism protein UlaG (beta-lactamase superfamily)
MSRLLAAALLLGTLSLGMVSAPARGDEKKPEAKKNEIKIRWHGQSMFEIVTPDGTTIITDPHALDAYGRKTLKADLVLMSHFHSDHIRVDWIENIKSAKVLNALKKDADGKREDFNVVEEKFKDVQLQSLASYHDNASGLQRGKNGIWVMDVAGLRLVHLGDLGHTLSAGLLKKLGTVDVLMIPVGGVYTLNGIDAQKVVDQVKPKRWVLPMHYGTVVYDDLLPLKYFLDEQEEGTVVKGFKPGDGLSIDPKSPAPKKYQLGILHWN